jgi:hypothetical protein
MGSLLFDECFDGDESLEFSLVKLVSSGIGDDVVVGCGIGVDVVVGCGICAGM